MPAPRSLFALYLSVLFFPFLCNALPAGNASDVLSPDRKFYVDCLEVIRAFPSDYATPQPFTRDAASGRYKLPQKQRYGTCTGNVKFDSDARTERSSWRAIRHKLDELNNICYREGYVRAMDRVGLGHQIEVKLQRYSPRDDETDSTTTDESEATSKT